LNFFKTLSGVIVLGQDGNIVCTKKVQFFSFLEKGLDKVGLAVQDLMDLGDVASQCYKVQGVQVTHLKIEHNVGMFDTNDMIERGRQDLPQFSNLQIRPRANVWALYDAVVHDSITIPEERQVPIFVTQNSFKVPQINLFYGPQCTILLAYLGFGKILRNIFHLKAFAIRDRDIEDD
jgi:hypothetical protein